MDFIDHRSNATFQFKISATDERARLDDSGNFLVGKSATNIATVGAEVRGVGQLWATRDGGTPAALNRLTSWGELQAFYKDGVKVGSIQVQSGDLTIGHADTGFRFLDGSNAIIPWDITGNTNRDAVIDLGNTSNRFADLHLSGNANIGGNAVITGDLTVSGTTTTINTATLDVEDNNITLNYGTGDTSSTADGAGITIQDAVDASNDATILWNASGDKFVFSHDISVTGASFADNAKAFFGTSNDLSIFHDGSNSYVKDTGTGDLMLQGVNVRIQGATTGNNMFVGVDNGASTLYYQNNARLATTSAGIDVTGNIIADNNLTIQNSSAYGSIELGGVSGGFIDIKRPFSDDYDLRLIAEGDGGVINVASGELTIQRAGSAKLATTSTGIAVTGNATFADNGKAVFGAGNDLQIYHNGSHSFINEAGTGDLYIGASSNIALMNAAFSENKLLATTDGALTLYYDGSAKLATTSTGINITGNATFADNGKAIFGAGSDLSIYHDGSNSYITDSGTGNLYINASNLALNDADGNYYITGADGGTGGTVRIYHNNSQKLVTESTGINVTGTVEADAALIQADGATVTVSSADYEVALLGRRGSSGVDLDKGFLRLKDTGTTKVAIDSAGDSYLNGGFLGLGTNAPAAKLDIVDTSADVQMRVYKNDGTKNTRLTLTADDSGAKLHYRDADNAGALRFNNNLGEVMRITANTTQVGIGTTSIGAGATLQVAGETRIYPASGTAVLRFGSGGAEKGKLAVDASSNMDFETAGAQRLRIDSSGRVGVGTSSPTATLHVSDAVTHAASTEVALIQNTTTGQPVALALQAVADNGGTGNEGAIYFDAGADGTAANNQLQFTADHQSDTTPDMVITGDGNVGIKTTAPNDPLTVNGRVRFGDTATGISFSVQSTDEYRINGVDLNGSAWNSLHLRADGTTGLFIQKDTNYVAIGTTSPNYLLDVRGSAGIRSNEDGAVQLEIRNDSTGTSSVAQLFLNGQGNNLYIKNWGDGTTKANATEFLSTASDSHFIFSTANAERMRLDSSGNLLVGGTSTTPWSNATGTASDNQLVAREDGILGASAYKATASTGYVGYFNRTSTDGGILAFNKDGTTVGSIGVDSGDNLYITSTTANHSGLYLSTNLYAPLRAGSLVDDAISFGNSAYRYKDLYLSGGIKTNNNAIDINSGSSNTVCTFTSTDTEARIDLVDTTGSAQIRSRNDLRFYVNGGSTRAVDINSSGSFLVGKTSTGVSTVGVEARGNGFFAATRALNAVANFNRTSSDGDVVQFLKDGSIVGSITTTSGSLGISSSGSNISLTATGVGLYADSGVFRGYLSDDATLDLGASNARWKDLYLSNNIVASGASSPTLNLKDTTNNCNILVYAQNSDAHVGTYSNHPLIFDSNSSERARLDASGNLLVGKTSADNTTQGIRFLGSSGFMSIVRSNGTAIIVNRIDGDGTLMEFRTNGTTRGSISISGSTTSYNTTSDERLKQNIEDADDAGAIVDSIQVRKFDWIDGGEHQRYGMVAQELGTVAPEAVSVPDDAEEMQSVDYSKLVPMLVKEIQSLRARVAQLEGEN